MMTILIATTKGEWIQLSPEDADLADFLWTKNSRGYATRHGSRSVPLIVMHRIIMERVLGRCCLYGEIVDHVNGNTLDNRRSNLRLVTPQQNIFNKRSHKNSSSAHKGVYRRKDGVYKWAATIRVQGKHCYLGSFSTETEAAKAYNEAATKHYGAYARLNIVT